MNDESRHAVNRRTLLGYTARTGVGLALAGPVADQIVQMHAKAQQPTVGGKSSAAVDGKLSRLEEFDMKSLAELKSRVRGQVLLPGEAGYDTERSGWNLIVEHRPAVIVVASGPEDIAASVRFAVAAGLPAAVQATGHGPAVPANGAVLISTRHMTDLAIDPAAATARIGPGVTWARVSEVAGALGLAPLAGSAPTVGAVGYLTSGGLPVLGRRYGFAADHVRALELVTADGRLRRATADEHPDLFWAVRGGKGNFGVVTAIEIDLMRLSRLYGGALVFPGAKTEEVLRGWREWAVTQPGAMDSSLALSRFPDLPGLPDPVRGKFVVRVWVAFAGAPAEADRLLRPLRALGPTTDTVAEMPAARLGEIPGSPTEPAPIRDGGILLGDLDDRAVDRIAVLAGPDAALPPGLIEIRLFGGALGQPPATPNAISHRDAAFGMNLGMLAPPRHEGDVVRIQQALIDGLRPWATGGTLPNYLGGFATRPEQVRAAYSDADYTRLAAIKAGVDPHNLFRINHNIPPALAAESGMP